MQRQEYCIATLHSICTNNTYQIIVLPPGIFRSLPISVRGTSLFVSSQVRTRPIRFFAMVYRSITEGENIDIGSPSAIATIRHIEVVHCDVLEGLLRILEI
jgi:hypothetical protein